MKKYENLIEQIIKEDSFFEEAFDLAKKNSLGGKIGVTGSFLYKNIIMREYGVQDLIVKDYDFFLENIKGLSKMEFPERWELRRTFFGSARFVYKDLQVDVYSEKHGKNSEEQINWYLKNVLFDIQAMAYEITQKKIYDAGAIKAIQERKTNITNLEHCISIAKKKNISIGDYIKNKSSNLGVEVIYPEILLNNSKVF